MGAPAIREYDIDAGTLWGKLFDTFTTSEQSCIRNELGDELLESALERRAMSEGDTEQWEASIFGCLAPETAAGIFLSALVAEMEGLSEEGETCLRELLADADVAGIVAGTLPDASPAAATAALEFTVGLLSCVPEQMLPGDAGPPDPPQADESLLWRYPTGEWVVNAPTVADGAVYFGSDDNHVYALDTETGELLWRFETNDVIRSTPTVTGRAVYVGSNDNHVVCPGCRDRGVAVELRHRRLGAVLTYRKWRDGLPRRTGGGGPQGPRSRRNDRRSPVVCRKAVSVHP